MLDGVDDNSIGCLTPHGISAGMEETMMLHGVDDGADGGVSHLIHLTQKFDCCLMQRMKHNACGECQYHGVPNVKKSRSFLSKSAKSNNGKEVDVSVADCVDSHVNDSVNVDVKNGGETHLTCFTQEVDYCLMERKKQNVCGECQDHEVLNVTKSR
eukprot:6437599-Ditylum_brightwellii.AAC.1